MTIGELARAAAVPTSTVRYYERAGLVEPAGRTEGNYRFYGRDSVERLRFIRSSQELGFTLDDIAILLGLRSDDESTCGEVQTLMEQRLVDIEKRLADMKRVRTALKSHLSLCRTAQTEGRCEVIDELTDASSLS